MRTSKRDAKETHGPRTCDVRETRETLHERRARAREEAREMQKRTTRDLRQV